MSSHHTERIQHKHEKLQELDAYRTKAIVSLFLIPLLAGIGGWGFILKWWVRDWPKTEAVGISASFEKRTSGGRSRSTQYVLDLRYQYIVNGRAYTGTTFRWRANYVPSQADAEELVLRYGSRQRFTIHYDPHNPTNAFIQYPPWRGTDLLFLAFGIFNVGRVLYYVNEYFTTRAFYRIRMPELFLTHPSPTPHPPSKRAQKKRMRRQ